MKNRIYRTSRDTMTGEWRGPDFSGLPVAGILADLRHELEHSTRLVLQAPPGAGKTTCVPLALLPESWLQGKRILMLEPRRLATRAAAFRMAEMLGEVPGETVGYRMRMDTRVGPRTRIEVLTEGTFTRLIQDDAALADIGLVIFDEFHERSLDADLGLALTRDVQKGLRPDLRILLMSATLQADRLADDLGCRAIQAEGHCFPVRTEFASARPPQSRLPEAVVATVLRLIKTETGSILAFLPGSGEIRRAHALLKAASLSPDIHLAALYGDLPRHAQQQAVEPAPPGIRKVVLATDIAETSITIEGVRAVIDCGFRRVSRFDARTGMSRLTTVPISQAAAEQRRGRAGRTEPGICCRLWTEAQHAALETIETPEILSADLAAMALQLACWGVRDAAQLDWIDPPPPAPMAQAQSLLRDIGALTVNATPSAHGRKLAALPLHPRLAHMLENAAPAGLRNTACAIAALLSERDLLRTTAGPPDPDVRRRLDLLQRAETGGEADAATIRQVKRASRELRQSCNRDNTHVARAAADGIEATEKAGILLAMAYPDRIAQRRPGSATDFLLANGRGVSLPAPGTLSQHDFVAIAHADDHGRNARIFLAAPLTLEEIYHHFGHAVCSVEEVSWDKTSQAVAARKTEKYQKLILRTAPLANPDPQQTIRAVLCGIRETGLNCLPWNRDSRIWQARVRFVRGLQEGDEKQLPDMSDEALMKRLELWLAPHIHGMTRLSQLSRLQLMGLLQAQLTWEQQQRLDDWAPTHLQVASGSRVRLDYLSGEVPVLPVRLQEMFGTRETPRIAGGRVAVLVHLLSPAGRPVQVTQDLASFWRETYYQVRKDLRGRYPKHAWPDDPLTAQPQRGTGRGRGRS
jgi:ATP-dependent helicase HrpB